MPTGMSFLATWRKVIFDPCKRHHLSVRITQILCCGFTRAKFMGCLSHCGLLIESLALCNGQHLRCTTNGYPILHFLKGLSYAGDA